MKLIATRQGAMIVLMAILLPVLVLLAAFVINLAQMELNRTELYIAADISARAGGRVLATTQDPAMARDVAKQFAELNDVYGDPLTLDDNDVKIGTSTRQGSGRYEFSEGGGFPNAVMVDARRTDSAPDGTVPMILPNIIGNSNGFSVTQEAVSTQVDVDIALVIDRSGSMAYGATEPAVFPPNPASASDTWSFCDAAPPASRWRDVVAATTVFLQELNSTGQQELVGLATYNETGAIDQELTSSYSQILDGLDVYTQSFCEGGTNIGGGISAGVDLFNGVNSRPGAIKVVIVLTDGIHNIGLSPNSAANTAAANGAMIFTVTFSNEADQTRMQQVASIGSGKHFHAATSQDLIAVFQEISKELPNLLTL